MGCSSCKSTPYTVQAARQQEDYGYPKRCGCVGPCQCHGLRRRYVPYYNNPYYDLGYKKWHGYGRRHLEYYSPYTSGLAGDIAYCKSRCQRHSLPDECVDACLVDAKAIREEFKHADQKEYFKLKDLEKVGKDVTSKVKDTASDAVKKAGETVIDKATSYAKNLQDTLYRYGMYALAAIAIIIAVIIYIVFFR